MRGVENGAGAENLIFGHPNIIGSVQAALMTTWQSCDCYLLSVNGRPPYLLTGKTLVYFSFCLPFVGVLAGDEELCYLPLISHLR